MDERLPSVSWFLSCGRLCRTPPDNTDSAAPSHMTRRDSSVTKDEDEGSPIDYREEDIRPAASYRQLITEAIAAIEPCKGDKILLSDIYAYLKENYAFFRNSDSSWKNSIRHNLAQNKFFMKVPRSSGEAGAGRGAYWRMNKSFDEGGGGERGLKRRGSEERRFAYERQPRNGSTSQHGDECETPRRRRMPESGMKRKDSRHDDGGDVDVQPQRKRQRGDMLSIQDLPTIVLSPADPNCVATTPISPFGPCTLNKLSLSDHIVNDRNRRSTPPLMRCVDEGSTPLTSISPPFSADDFSFRSHELVWNTDARMNSFENDLQYCELSTTPSRPLLSDDVFELSPPSLDGASSPQPSQHPWHDEAMLANDDVFLPS